MGSQEQERCTFLGLKDKNALFGWVTPFLHTEPSLYDCRKVQRSQIFKQNLIISLHLSFIAFVVIWGLPGSYGWGGGCGCVWMCPLHAPTCIQMYACIHTCITLKYTCMYRYCKWPPPWRHPCLLCL